MNTYEYVLLSRFGNINCSEKFFSMVDFRFRIVNKRLCNYYCLKKYLLSLSVFFYLFAKSEIIITVLTVESVEGLRYLLMLERKQLWISCLITSSYRQ